MKKVVLLTALLLSLLVTNSTAQTYSINKLKYDSRLYTAQSGDPYNPTVAGLCSFLVPGLGQMTCGETDRGLAFMGGFAGAYVVCITGAVMQISSNIDNTHPRLNTKGMGIMLLGFAGAAGVSIWSIVDAVKVAKVNNMYFRDLRKSSQIKMELTPYVTQININNQVTTPVGMTMRVTF